MYATFHIIGQLGSGRISLTSSGVVGCLHKTDNKDSECMAFLLVVMATLLLQSGNVERNPGPTIVGKGLFLPLNKFRYLFDFVFPESLISGLQSHSGLGLSVLVLMLNLLYVCIDSSFKSESLLCYSFGIIFVLYMCEFKTTYNRNYTSDSFALHWCYGSV